MSPDNGKVSPEIQRLIDAHSALRSLSGELDSLLGHRLPDFRGLTVMLGQGGDWLAIVKRYGDDGTPEILFSAGSSPISSLVNIDSVVASRGYQPDKRAIEAGNG